MNRLFHRLVKSFSQRSNPPIEYIKTINQFPAPKYLVGNIINNFYLNQNWKSMINEEVNVAGWVRNVRISNIIMFINLFDGTASKQIQIVIDKDHPDWDVYAGIKKGYSLKISGTIKQITFNDKKPSFYQLFVESKQKIEILGQCDPSKYVLSAKNVKLETVRDYLHLRAKTLRMSAVSRIRNILSFSTHSFYQQNGFIYLHTPLITTSDCEGAGQMFHVTTLIKDNKIELPSNKEIDFSKDFFKRPAGLTVSGQLAAQAFCCGMSKVYTFGPTFRAEVSHTTRHVAQFWMIQPEFAFADLYDAMDLAQAYIKSSVMSVLAQNKQDLTYLQSKSSNKSNSGLQERLSQKVSSFKRITYTEAIQLLQNSNVKFQNKVQWGCDLSTQHQRYLCEQITKCPTFVYNYPAKIKPFYMRVNQDGKTVASFDLLVPGIGQIIGGSQREERLQCLEKRMQEMSIPKQNLDWYLDLRRFGTVVHSGFGVGFDRLVMFVTETENIRDVIPFPRTPGRADC